MGVVCRLLLVLLLRAEYYRFGAHGGLNAITVFIVMLVSGFVQIGPWAPSVLDQCTG